VTISTGKINLNDFDRRVVLNMTGGIVYCEGSNHTCSVYTTLYVKRKTEWKWNASSLLEFSEEWGSCGRLFKDEGRCQKFLPRIIVR
jgi:hypothetical protein